MTSNVHFHACSARSIARKDMAAHIERECGRKKVHCGECKQEILRKDEADHVNICTEHAVDCPFKEFGCDSKVKRRLINDHLENSEMEHLKLKVLHVRVHVLLFISWFGDCSWSSANRKGRS